MAIPTVSTYEIPNAPRRPGISDVGGAAFVDDQAFPPDPVSMPSAAMENQNEFLMVAAHRVTPVCSLSVTWNGAAYVISYLEVCSALVSIGTFTVTKNSVGNVSITWPANTFPASTGQPRAGFTLSALLYNATIGAQSITNGVQMFMTAGSANTAAGAGSDQSFWVEIH